MGTKNVCKIYAWKRRSAEKKENGECLYCTNKSEEGANYCTRHIIKNKEKYQRAKLAKKSRMWKVQKNA